MRPTCSTLESQIKEVDNKVIAVSNLVGNESVSNQISEALLNSQADWNQIDNTQPDFIKNKPDEDDAIELLIEMNIVEPVVSEDGSIYTDENDAINDLGIDNLVKIQKTAKIARAQAEKEIKIAEAQADEEGAKARSAADAKIAEQQKELKLKKASFKIEQDKKNAEADAAYKIQEAEQLKTINVDFTKYSYLKNNLKHYTILWHI